MLRLEPSGSSGASANRRPELGPHPCPVHVGILRSSHLTERHKAHRMAHSRVQAEPDSPGSLRSPPRPSPTPRPALGPPSEPPAVLQPTATKVMVCDVTTARVAPVPA